MTKIKTVLKSCAHLFQLTLMSIVFITKSNMKKLEPNMDSDYFDKNQITIIYENKLGLILAEPELRFLSATKLVLEAINDVDGKFVNLDIPVLKLRTQRTTYPKSTRLIYLNSGPPAFHQSVACERLNQDYVNYEIPTALPDDVIPEYRNYFLANIHLMDQDPEKFYFRVSIKFSKFGLTTNSIRNTIKYDNSGIEGFRNIQNADELARQLKAHLLKMQSFRDSSEETEKLISKYGYGSHKAICTKTKELFIKMVPDHPIKIWNKMKSELKQILLDHIIATTNPALAFERSMLEAVGFVPCKNCHEVPPSP